MFKLNLLNCFAAGMVLFLCTNSVYSQYQKLSVNVPKEYIKENAAAKSGVMQAEFIGFRNPEVLHKDWRPFLNNSISKNESEDDAQLKKIKEEKDKIKQQSSLTNKTGSANEITTGTLTPVLGTNFIGIDNGGGNSPLDNTIAVSNGGHIVACVNSRIEYDDVSGNYLGGQTLVNLINDGSISTNLCDPKVIYDSGADRFILFVQTCDGLAASSKIIIGFSATNNPSSGGWYFYKISGNPLNNNCWFDYPKMAVSNTELFVTGNLFGNSGGPFNQAVIFQIEKSNGFTGGSINWQYWSNINGAPFTVCPVSWGQQGNYGPGIYLVSTAGTANNVTTVNLYEITNVMSASNEQLMHYTIPTAAYSMGGNAQQSGSSLVLNTGDCRTLSGFYLNGIIHFVFHSDIGSGYNGINYNRLNVSSGTNVSSTFGLSGSYDYCYPAVASIGSATNDKAALIVFSRSGTSVFPEVRAIVCDDQMNWSNSILVKAGESYVDYSWTSGTDERWGDYSGIARKYNSNPPAVWVSGDYSSSSNYWKQWIAEITAISSIGINENNPVKPITANVYPNPVVDIYTLEFTMPAAEQILITVTDLQGKLVKELYSGTCYTGKNIFTFNKAQLEAGAYFITIQSNHKNLKNEKIIITEK